MREIHVQLICREDCCCLKIFSTCCFFEQKIMAIKENVGECPPPKKKHELSLFLKYKPLVPQQETRFAEPVSEYEVKLASKSFVPDNTKRNNK